jgi:hypothetical protein
MIKKATIFKKNFKIRDDYYRKVKIFMKRYGTYFDWPKYSKGSKSKERVKNMRLIKVYLIIKDIFRNDHKEL